MVKIDWLDIVSEKLKGLSESPQAEGIQAFTIRGMSDAQELAIREYARTQDFKDLRGFHMYMKSEELDYYDIIKIASPEG